MQTLNLQEILELIDTFDNYLHKFYSFVNDLTKQQHDITVSCALWSSSSMCESS